MINIMIGINNKDKEIHITSIFHKYYLDNNHYCMFINKLNSINTIKFNFIDMKYKWKLLMYMSGMDKSI